MGERKVTTSNPPILISPLNFYLATSSVTSGKQNSHQIVSSDKVEQTKRKEIVNNNNNIEQKIDQVNKILNIFRLNVWWKSYIKTILLILPRKQKGPLLLVNRRKPELHQPPPMPKRAQTQETGEEDSDVSLKSRTECIKQNGNGN